MPTDSELLRQYADQGDEAAFAELVRRHTDLVYSVAKRVTCNGALAEDVTQAVFTIVALQAKRLKHYDPLLGWLHTTARHRAIDAVRCEGRRHIREQEATTMQNDSAAPETNWADIGPMLDEAVGQLRETDRDAVLLRFFKNLSHQEVGAALGLGEDAARKRVDRALDKLREYFARRGVTASSALLATAITENSMQAAPVGLVARVTGPALAAAAGAGVTTGGIFLKILFMSTQAKLAAVAIIVIIATAITLNWPRANQPSVATVQPALVIAGAAATTTGNKTPPAPQVAQPVVAAVNPSKPSVPTAADLPANFDPRAKIAKDEMMEDLLYMAKITKESATRDKTGITHTPEFWVVAEEETALQAQYCVDALPTINDDGDLATFTVDDATWNLMQKLSTTINKNYYDPRRPKPSTQYAKVNGEWRGIERDPYAKPLDKNPYVLEAVAQDPFAKSGE
jgi:RNA polymerase sigma factor (sigma-70 family)